MYKQYEEQGFHIIGLECQNSSAADIATLAKSKGVTYQLTTGGDLKGSNVTGIPHGFLFGADGKLLANNPRGKELESKVKEAVKDVAGMMAGPGPYIDPRVTKAASSECRYCVDETTRHSSRTPTTPYPRRRIDG